MTPSCSFPNCPTLAPHDMHLFCEKSSPLGMRVASDRRAVYLWLPDQSMVKQAQPDAVRKLRTVVQAWEREQVTA